MNLLIIQRSESHCFPVIGSDLMGITKILEDESKLSPFLSLNIPAPLVSAD